MKPSLQSPALRRLARATDGAVAPLVAVSLFALVAIGGVSFDYARLASLDSELQNAADQAALAAASQLDHESGAIERATAAAQSLIANQTLMANEAGSTGAITIPTVMFYSTKPNAEDNVSGFTDTARFADAKFVRVAVAGREAFYALTPIVRAFRSGSIGAEAVAGIGSAICKTPPVMMCNPAEPDANTNVNLDFDAARLAGAGVLLIAGDADAPGNFGFLDTGDGSGNSTPELATSLGHNVPPGDCQPTTGVDLKTGARDVVLNALNTRFDISQNGTNTCPGTGTCSPSRNVRKDLVKGSSCVAGGGQGWDESPNPYRPTTGTPLTSGYPDIMGHPRDICHARATEAAIGTYCTASNVPAGSPAGTTYNGRIGDKLWDRDAYFLVNYGWDSPTWKSNTGLTASATRYQVYQWELNNTATSDKTQVIGSNTGYSFPVCRAPGITPGGTNVDRRRISMAVINCAARGLNGSENDVAVTKWVDVFLVEPAFVRKRGTTAVTGGRDVYVEIIGETITGAAGATAGQVVRRDVPYLVK